MGGCRAKNKQKNHFFKINFKFLQRVLTNIQACCNVALCQPVNSCLAKPEDDGTAFLRKDVDS